MSNYFDSLADNWDANILKVERAKITAQKIKEVAFHSFNSCIDFGSGTGFTWCAAKGYICRNSSC